MKALPGWENLVEKLGGKTWEKLVALGFSENL